MRSGTDFSRNGALLCAACTIIGSSWAAAARADSAALKVLAEPQSCPGPSLLREALAPLLPTAQVVEAPEEGSEAEVRDEGDRYSIRVGDAQRTVLDAGRVCLERARVAAVFIALNVREKRAPAPAPAPPAPPAAPPAATAPPAPDKQGARVAARALLAGALAARPSSKALGATLGLTLRSPCWGVGIDAGVLGPSRISGLGTNTQQSVELWQFPATLRGQLLGRFGPLELAPSVGATLELLRLSGEAVAQPDTAYRAQAGFLVGLDASTYVSVRLQVVVALDMRVFPRPYRLVVSPDEQLTESPSLWFVGGLGIAYDFVSTTHKQ